MHVMDSLRSPELKSRGLSPHVHYFIEKMMAKDADLRYQSWNALVDDIREQLQGRESLIYGKDAKSSSSSRTRGQRPRPPTRR
jgi:hypothetical protein